MEGVIAHELSHFKRADTLVSAVAVTVLAPLTWVSGNDRLLHRVLGYGRELRADQVAVRAVRYPPGLGQRAVEVRRRGGALARARGLPLGGWRCRGGSGSTRPSGAVGPTRWGTSISPSCASTPWPRPRGALRLRTRSSQFPDNGQVDQGIMQKNSKLTALTAGSRAPRPRGRGDPLGCLGRHPPAFPGRARSGASAVRHGVRGGAGRAGVVRHEGRHPTRPTPPRRSASSCSLPTATSGRACSGPERSTAWRRNSTPSRPSGSAG